MPHNTCTKITTKILTINRSSQIMANISQTKTTIQGHRTHTTTTIINKIGKTMVIDKIVATATAAHFTTATTTVTTIIMFDDDAAGDDGQQQ